MLRLALAFVFIALPLLELTLLIKSGQVIGFWATLAMVVGAGLLGALIVSRQGLIVVRRTQQALAQGRPPVAPVLDGVFLLLAGALLMTPGFLSDVLALLLLIPPVRLAVARWSVQRLVKRALDASGAKIDTASRPSPSRSGRKAGPVIEGEFERLSEQATGPHRRTDRDRL